MALYNAVLSRLRTCLWNSVIAYCWDEERSIFPERKHHFCERGWARSLSLRGEVITLPASHDRLLNYLIHPLRGGHTTVTFTLITKSVSSRPHEGRGQLNDGISNILVAGNQGIAVLWTVWPVWPTAEFVNTRPIMYLKSTKYYNSNNYCYVIITIYRIVVLLHLYHYHHNYFYNNIYYSNNNNNTYYYYYRH